MSLATSTDAFSAGGLRPCEAAGALNVAVRCSNASRSLSPAAAGSALAAASGAAIIAPPGLYTWGFNDETCPPTSMYAAYNVIPGNKRLMLAIETGHNNVPEQVAEVNAWLEGFLVKVMR